jgi:hypothetical protein
MRYNIKEKLKSSNSNKKRKKLLEFPVKDIRKNLQICLSTIKKE